MQREYFFTPSLRSCANQRKLAVHENSERTTTCFLVTWAFFHVFPYVFPLQGLILWCFTINITTTIWVCLKIGYIPNYSHLIGIMISKTIGFRGTLFSDTPIFSGKQAQRSPAEPSGPLRPQLDPLGMSQYRVLRRYQAAWAAAAPDFAKQKLGMKKKRNFKKPRGSYPLVN